MSTYRIFESGKEINTIESDKDFVARYCKKHGYSFEEYQMPPVPETEPEPTQLDIIEAQVTYTAMMTDTLLEV